MIKDLIRMETGAVEALRELGYDDPVLALTNLRLIERGPLGECLERISETALASPSPSGALNNLERVASGLDPGTLERLAADADTLGRLISICASSQYLATILVQRPELFEGLFAGGGLSAEGSPEAFASALAGPAAGAADFDEMARELRYFKQTEFLRIGARDLLGVADVRVTTREISDVASATLDAAVAFASRELERSYGAPVYIDDDGAGREAEFAVIGLGKLGGRELNFSSDIDILYVYSSDSGRTTGRAEGDAVAAGSTIDLHAYFVKLSTMVTRLISAPTADGYVFRVDLDLRPEGPSGAMANSIPSAEAYYESWGQSWERAAMIKARPVAGSAGLGAEFLDMIRPFVFRRYLDFSTIEEIKSMKEKINLSQRRRAPDAVDVKLGRGGIREIEFICQALELVHGGKDEELREKNTLAAVEVLRRKGYLTDNDAASLTASYVFLRNLEHRIQIVEARQTQAIPARPAELRRLARMMGFADTPDMTAAEAFWHDYRRRTNDAHNIFRSLFYRSEDDEERVEVSEEILHLLDAETGAEEGAGLLAGLGFCDPEAAFRNLTFLRGGPAYLKLGSKAAGLLERLAPMLLDKAASSPDPDMALSHLELFLSAVGARTTLYSLLYENPPVAGELLTLFGTSVFLSRTLIEHPESLDIFLARELSVPYKDRGAMAREFAREAGKSEDFEETLDAMRRLRNQEVFRVGINDVAGLLTPRQVSLQLSFLAEAILDAAISVAGRELVVRFGRPPETASFAVLGLGKLGGRELIYGSDLDIIFVYSDSATGEGGTAGGERSLTTHEYYIKLCQKVISVLSARTKDGVLFSVDTRLRPSGSSGPLVVSSESFLGYHSKGTEAWERQAQVRTRPVAGDTAFGAEVTERLREIIFGFGLGPEDARELLRIRKRMEDEIAREDSTRYNIKTGRGGLVDIEFLVQTLQLAHGGGKTSLRTPYTVKALARLGREGILAPEDKRTLQEAYDFYRILEMRLRIVHDRAEGYLKAGTEELSALARGVGYSGEEPAERLWADYASRSEGVREIYLRTIEGFF